MSSPSPPPPPTTQNPLSRGTRGKLRPLREPVAQRTQGKGPFCFSPFPLLGALAGRCGFPGSELQEACERYQAPRGGGLAELS